MDIDNSWFGFSMWNDSDAAGFSVRLGTYSSGFLISFNFEK